MKDSYISVSTNCVSELDLGLYLGIGHKLWNGVVDYYFFFGGGSEKFGAKDSRKYIIWTEKLFLLLGTECAIYILLTLILFGSIRLNEVFILASYVIYIYCERDFWKCSPPFALSSSKSVPHAKPCIFLKNNVINPNNIVQTAREIRRSFFMSPTAMNSLCDDFCAVSLPE